MDDNTKQIQEQIELATLRSWCRHMTDDIISLRITLASVIFYLEFEVEEHDKMIELLQSTLDNTFDPESGDNSLPLSA